MRMRCMTMIFYDAPCLLTVYYCCILFCCHLCTSVGVQQQQEGERRLEIEKLKQLAYSQPDGSPQFNQAWGKILQLDPQNLEAHFMLGWSLAHSRGVAQERGFQLLEASFDPAAVSPSIDFRFPQTLLAAATIGRYRSQRREFAQARKFTRLALELSKQHGNPAHMTEDGDICIQMQLATMFDYFPNSTDAADNAIADIQHHAYRLLAHQNWTIDDHYLSQLFTGADPDPYVHCMLSLFTLSFYYRADVAAIASNNYEIARRGWPALNATADFVRRYDMEEEHPCVRRKIRLLVISAVLTEGHSNSESFGGMLSRLDRNIFEVTYVLLAEQEHAGIASFTRRHPEDRSFVWRKEAGDVSNGSWTNRMAKEIESWEMDIIFHFELSMSSYARRLGMQRLAPVQVNSIGHPITSGHDRSIIQYYISWAAAELPLEEAQAHYTEELIMLPSDIIYQYYEPRILHGKVSRMDGQPFGHLDRSDFGLPPNKTIYLCMQQPVKFHPEFDELLCGIMSRDSKGWVVLHRAMSPANQMVFEERLKRNGCDLSRITFFDQQPHHRLLALYRNSTVILDSYPAGGDTTTREVLEMGKPLVTLPTRLLGGRWSLGYINNIGLKDSTKKALIANSPGEYVSLAVRLGTDDAFRRVVENDIRNSANNLFFRSDAVAAWQKILMEISPYQQCQVDDEETGGHGEL